MKVPAMPYAVTWDLTYRCNWTCTHCFFDLKYYQEEGLRELSTEEALTLVDEMGRERVFDLALAGGEPMVRNDFWRIVERIRHWGIQFMVATNGNFVHVG